MTNVSTIESEAIIQILVCLLEHPAMFSFIEPDYADDISCAGYFNMAEGGVTASGRDFLQMCSLLEAKQQRLL